MAAAAVDSVAIVHLRCWANGQTTACEENETIPDSTDLLGERKWQIGDLARWRPSYIPGPFAPPIHFRILPPRV